MQMHHRQKNINQLPEDADKAIKLLESDEALLAETDKWIELFMTSLRRTAYRKPYYHLASQQMILNENLSDFDADFVLKQLPNGNETGFLASCLIFMQGSELAAEYLCKQLLNAEEENEDTLWILQNLQILSLQNKDEIYAALCDDMEKIQALIESNNESIRRATIELLVILQNGFAMSLFHIIRDQGVSKELEYRLWFQEIVNEINGESFKAIEKTFGKLTLVIQSREQLLRYQLMVEVFGKQLDQLMRTQQVIKQFVGLDGTCINAYQQAKKEKKIEERMHQREKREHE
ncbi:Conserved_hypothetical protein [Hexamita inflata]|uniref:Uncharacterized protein n=1 Tax=Hexamita inflata TaxID=28002 RepID=A0AA86QQD2_9EUKA|nr:Conserved hypothetical protein [Hexamita inflata]